jgi:dihydrofolate synthase/folylpolyglutamate synthase
VGGQVVSIRTPKAEYEDLVLMVHGDHAARNAAAGIVALEAFLEQSLDADATMAAFASFTTPGRLEVVGRHPLMIVDGAHNPAAAAALVEALRETFAWNRLLLVVAGFSSHDLGAVISTLAPIADRAYATENRSPRSRPRDEIAGFLAANDVPTETFGSVAEALASARTEAAEDDLILVTGSLYTVADARRALEEP